MVLVDESLLAAAILNLAINARNAMPNGGTQEGSSSCHPQFEWAMIGQRADRSK